MNNKISTKNVKGYNYNSYSPRKTTQHLAFEVRNLVIKIATKITKKLENHPQTPIGTNYSDIKSGIFTIANKNKPNSKRIKIN